MGGKTPISFDLQIYVEKHCSIQCTMKHENKANCNTGYIVPDLIE